MATAIPEHLETTAFGYSIEIPYDPYREQAELEATELKPKTSISTEENAKYTGDSASRDVAHQKRTEQWSPRLLRLGSLAIVVVLLLVLIALAELFIRRSPYPAPTSSALIFVWTYLPTTVIVFIDWIWQSYDLEIKMLLPWALLSNAAPRREQPWILDYRSMFYPTAMWHAARHKHFVVLLASTGFWIAAVASVMSTSLWAIEDLSRTQSVSLALASTMPSSDVSSTSGENETYVDFFLAHHLSTLPLPRWIVENNTVLEPFGLAGVESMGSNATLFGNTKAYSATLDCIGTNVSYTGDIVTGALVLNVDAAGCSAHYPLPTSENLAMEFSDDGNATVTFYFGSLLQHVCPGATNVTTILSSANATAIMNSTRFVFSESPIYSASVACVPQYQQTILAVTAPPSSSSFLDISTLSDHGEPFTCPGGDTFLQVFNNKTVDLLEVSWQGGYSPPTNTIVTYGSWFQLLQLLSNVSREALLDQDVLVNTSKTAFEQLWPTYALYDLFVASGEDPATISGLAKNIDRVLYARPISVRVLQSMLALLALDAILIYTLRPRAILPLNPSSLTAMAVLLEKSDSSVHTAMHGTGEMTESHFQEEMEKWHFTTTAENGFTIRATNAHGRTKNIDRPSEDSSYESEGMTTSRNLWRPVILHPMSQLVLLSLLAITVAVLEVLYRLSVAREGLAAMPSGLPSYWWSYVAPAYISILGVLTASYDFHTRALQPYVAMAQHPQPVQKSLGYNPAAHTGLSLLWHSFRFRSIVGVATSVSLLIVPFMKIAVAGLLVVSPQAVTNTANLTPITTFESNFNATPLYGGEVFSASLQPAELWPLTQVPQYGLPIPAWTTSGAAIGEVDLSTLDVSPQQNATLTVPLPIFSSVLGNCTNLDPEDYGIASSGQTASFGRSSLRALEELSTVNTSCQPLIQLTTLPDVPSYFGQVLGSFPVEYCAGVYFIIYGFSTGPLAQNITNSTLARCQNNMTISTRMVTLDLSSSNYSDPTILSISDVADPADVEVVSGAANLTTVFDYGFNLVVPPLYINTEAVGFDVFFEVLVLRNQAAPLWSFSNPDVLIPTIQELWSSFWAFWASYNMRIPVDASVHSASALMYTQRSRICQDWVATRVMQALLGATLLCNIISAILLRNSGRALPKAPYSIGAQMSLLVDSSFLDLVSQQREEKDALAAANRCLEAHRFSLGWSNDNLGNSRFGIEREDASL